MLTNCLKQPSPQCNTNEGTANFLVLFEVTKTEATVAATAALEAEPMTQAPLVGSVGSTTDVRDAGNMAYNTSSA